MRALDHPACVRAAVVAWHRALAEGYAEYGAARLAREAAYREARRPERRGLEVHLSLGVLRVIKFARHHDRVELVEAMRRGLSWERITVDYGPGPSAARVLPFYRPPHRPIPALD